MCVIYLASSPKSNSVYKAINKAIEYTKNTNDSIPSNIVHFNSNYKYPHDFGGYVQQRYLPDEVLLNDEVFVQWSDIGFEKTLKSWLDLIRGNQKLHQ